MVKSFKTNLLTWLKTKTYIKTEIDELLQLKSNIGHTHTNASTTTPGFLSAEDKTKLNNLKQITVDSTINATSTNPVQNKAVNSALNGKANSSHTHMGREIHPDFSVNSNGASTTAYRKILRITINSKYCDEPITFNLSQRNETMHNRVHIKFKSSTDTDPDLHSFYVEGIKSMPLYLYKESVSTWILLSKEVNNYDYVSISDLLLTNRNRDYFTFTPLTEQVTTLPTTNIYTAMNTVDSSLSSTSANPVQNKVITNALNGKANSTHTHDDRYYTETEMNTKLNGKANSSHTHTASQISDLAVSTHTLANGAKLYKYGKIVMCVLFNVAFSGKKAYTWNGLFTNIPSTYQPIGGTNPIYAHSSEIMLSVQGSDIQIYPHKTSGSVFNTLVWITA